MGTTGVGREAIIEMAKNIVMHDRQATHGDPEDNFRAIAQAWSWWVGRKLEGEDVAAMMVLFKLARIKGNPHNLDSWIDAVGYAVCGGARCPPVNSDQA